jgi:lysophospholipase L1-like esterase
MKSIYFAISVILISLLLCSGKNKPVRLFLVGDSTMADKSSPTDNPERGWGMVLPTFFNDNVIIENHARNGRSTKTFIAEGRWNFLIQRVSAGDFVVIQFSHNDEVETKKSFTPLPDFEENFRRFVRDVRAKSANPILCTPVARRKFDSIGNLIDTHPVYPQAIIRVATEMKVPLIDLETKSEEILKKYGVEESKKLFMHIEPGVWKSMPNGRQDDTHFVEKGALEMANIFVEGVKELKIKALKNNILNPKKRSLKLTVPVEGIDKVTP